jgi:hypothetical protein
MLKSFADRTAVIHDRHPALLALEIGQIAAISLFGAAVANVANRDRLAGQEVSASSRRRIETLAGSPGYWDRVAVTRMGQYVTKVESAGVGRSTWRNGLVKIIGRKFTLRTVRSAHAK